MSRLIVFVQGKNVNDVDISDKKRKRIYPQIKYILLSIAKRGMVGNLK